MHATSAREEKEFKAYFEGVVPNLQRRWDNTESEFVKARLHNYMSEQPCEKCKGAATETAGAGGENRGDEYSRSDGPDDWPGHHVFCQSLPGYGAGTESRRWRY